MLFYQIYSCNRQIKSNLLLSRQYPQRRPGSVAHQTSQCPKAKIQDSVQKRQQTTGCAGSHGGKAKSKRYVFRRLLKDAVEGADRARRGSLFHRVGPQERKALAPVLVLTLGAEMLIPLCDWWLMLILWHTLRYHGHNTLLFLFSTIRSSKTFNTLLISYCTQQRLCC